MGLTKVRKNWKCDLCSTLIKKGDRCYNWTIPPYDYGMWEGDGEWHNIHMHVGCWTYLDKFYDASSEGWSKDQFSDIMDELMHEHKISKTKAIDILKNTDWSDEKKNNLLLPTLKDE